MTSQTATAEVKQVIETITEIVSDYGKRHASLTVDEILNMKDRLTGYLFFYAGDVAGFKTDYNKKWFVRSIAITVEKNKLRQLETKLSDQKAKDMADETHQAKLKEQLTAEQVALKADLMLKQANRVVSAMEQRVSYLKMELSRTIYSSTNQA